MHPRLFFFGLLLGGCVLVQVAFPAQAGSNRCGERKALAAQIHQENDSVQEEHVGYLGMPGSDPNWCRHASSIIETSTELLAVIDEDSKHCGVSRDTVERLAKSIKDMKSHAEGCP